MKPNNLKWLFTALCITLLHISSFASDAICTVSGHINGIDKETKITLTPSKEHAVAVMTSITKANGDFSFTMPATMLNDLYNLNVEGVRNSLSFIAEKGTITIAADKNKLYMASVTGTPENNRWNTYQQFTMEQVKRSNEMMMGGDKYTREEKVALFYKQQSDKKRYVDSLVKNFPSSFVTFYLAKVPLMMLKHAQIDSLLTTFKPYFSTHPAYLAMKTRADILRKVAPGAIAPNFTVLKPDGKTKISLSSFRGKYVVLDFWASWCVPCRAENVHTKEIYEKFHPLGLEVISFSLDSDSKLWNEALKKDALVWHNASDLVGGLKSPVAKKYGIDGIPAIWVIDPNGKILAESIRGEALDKFLAKIFVKNKG